MLLMGGIVGIGIFANPSITARHLHTPLAILACWTAGGIFAFVGALIHAELASRMPVVGGQYAYIREGIHPSVAFVYGWTLFLVIETGGMAAVAIIFANYFLALSGLALPVWLVATIALAVLAAINCLGIRAGSSVQNGLMVIKILVLAVVIGAGIFLGKSAGESLAVTGSHIPDASPIAAFAVALVPVLFAYGGAHKTSYLAGEAREPQTSLVRGLLFGMIGVILLYLLVNVAYIFALGADGLASTDTPASVLMTQIFGGSGGTLIAIGISISALGLLSQAVLAAPRVLLAMSGDGLLFRAASRLHPRTHAPVVAIIAQTAMTVCVVVVGRYDQILNYVIAIESIFLGLNAICVFTLRRRHVGVETGFRLPGHPYTTVAFVAICWLISAATFIKFPSDSMIGLLIVAAGIPAYLIVRRFQSSRAEADSSAC